MMPTKVCSAILLVILTASTTMRRTSLMNEALIIRESGMSQHDAQAPEVRLTTSDHVRNSQRELLHPLQKPSASAISRVDGRGGAWSAGSRSEAKELRAQVESLKQRLLERDSIVNELQRQIQEDKRNHDKLNSEEDEEDSKSSSTSGGNNKSSCALLFYGVPRLFQSIALPSIQKYILRVNPTCDVFVHTYNQTELSVKRNMGETAAQLHPEDVLLLSNNNTMIEQPENFYAAHDLPWFHQHHHKKWGKDNFGSTDNMLKAWHSIQGAWNLMEDYQQHQQRRYQRVGIFRMDVFYTHPINIMDPTEPAVVPNFAWSLKTMKEINQKRGFNLINDRGFYGDYQYAKIWATKRFDYSPTYVANEPKNIKKGSVHRHRQGIQSESFVSELLQHYNVPVVEKEICFWRLRANGVVLFEDCRVPGQPDPKRNQPFFGNQGKANQAILNNLMCQGEPGRKPELISKCTEVE